MHKKYIRIPFLYVFVLVVLTSLLLSHITCSVDVAGFGSETTNGIVAGRVLDQSGNTANNTRMVLLPAHFNPVEDDTVNRIQTDTTDSTGAYHFTVTKTGTYTIHGTDLASHKQVIHKYLYVNKDTITILDTLKEPGVVRVMLPDTVDTTRGYIYLEGTMRSDNLHGCIVLGGGFYSLLVDSIPAGDIPAVHYRTTDPVSATVTISDSVVVISNDTVTIGIPDTLKPIWRFSYIVGVTEQTSAYFGGLDSIRKRIEAHVLLANKKFNDPNVFRGMLHFSVDSVYEFSTAVSNEIQSPPPGFDYRIIYNGLQAQDVGAYYRDERTMYHAWKIDYLFGNSSLDALTWNFGMSRGCWDLDGLLVKADKNPVNQQAYDGVTSIMNYPYGEDTWDAFSINVINYYANQVYYGPHILNSAFPASIGVVVMDETGNLVDSAEVQFYGVGWASLTVSTPAAYAGMTGNNGEYVFTVNPFDPDTTWPLEYANFLVSAATESDTAYAWMPITDVANAWFENSQGSYRVMVHF